METMIGAPAGGRFPRRGGFDRGQYMELSNKFAELIGKLKEFKEYMAETYSTDGSLAIFQIMTEFDKKIKVK